MNNRCPCDQCSPANPASTYTLEHQMACLARHVIALPYPARKRFLELNQRTGEAGRLFRAAYMEAKRNAGARK